MTSRNNACSRSSPATSGWKDVASTGPCRTATGCSPTLASTCTSGPTRSTHGALPDRYRGLGYDSVDALVGYARILH